MLVDLKRKYKQSKSLKERNGFFQEARRLVRSTSVDLSTQDEKSMTTFLNIATMFNCNVEDNIEQAVQWMRQNLGGLSSQNLALFTNAIGVLEIQDAKVILCEDIIPVIKSHLNNMTPVEIVMVLQAFQRLRINDQAEFQNDLLILLEPCIDTMHISELSTLVTTLSWHPMKTTDEPRWHAMTERIINKVLTDVDRIHSREAITLLLASTFLMIEQDRIVQLLRRVTTTSGFHTDEQIGDIFRALARIHKNIEKPEEELIHACKELKKALLARLERVVQFANIKSITIIWRNSKLCDVELPTALQEQILNVSMERFLYYQPRFRIICNFVKEAILQKLPSTAIFHVFSDYAIGKRPLRPDQNEQDSPSSDADDSGMFAPDIFFKRHFSELISLRLCLENVFAVNGATAPYSLTTTLPQELLAHVGEIFPKQALAVVRTIALFPDNKLQNTKNNEALLAAIEARIKREGSEFFRDISPNFIENVKKSIIDNPKTQNMAVLLAKLD
ncbi:unnamed protein product [Phytomonas sp. Hart1]|nr:unnamed protein product [Phytomonas sp. Hart1]|eukprot:CCW67993.1 unnamed protein product [Phytomonas sp. isolate Hart1]